MKPTYEIFNEDGVVVQRVPQAVVDKFASLILTRIGKDAALKAKDMKPYFGDLQHADRAFRWCREWLVQQGVQCCSTATINGGYFIAKTQEEAEEYATSRKKRAAAEIAGANRLSALNTNASLARATEMLASQPV